MLRSVRLALKPLATVFRSASWQLVLIGGWLTFSGIAQAAEAGDRPPCQEEKIRQPLTLATAVELALCHNPQTRVLWANSRVQAAQVGVNSAAYLPSLSATGSLNRNQQQQAASLVGSNSRTLGLSASYLLFDFGTRSANLDSARQLLIAANATRDATLQATYLSTVQAWFAVLSARASVVSLLAAEDSARVARDAAQARFQSGTATPADRLLAQTAWSQATLNRITAEGTLASANGTLANWMGFDASQPLLLADLPEPTVDAVAEREVGELIARARRQRPDLAAAEAQIQSAASLAEAARAAGWPTVNLTASATRSDVSGAPTSLGNSVGVSLSVPLFTGLRTHYQIQAAEAQRDSSLASRDRVASQIALDVWRAWQALRNNSQALQAAEDLQASAIQSEKMTLGRYQAGLGNVLDVLTAQTTLANARQQRISALYNFAASRFALAQAMGELDLSQPGLND